MNTLESLAPGDAGAKRGAKAADHDVRDASAHGLDAAAALFNLLRIVTAHDRDMVRRHGITPQQYQALLEIHFRTTPEPLTIGGLALRLGIRHNSVVGVVNKLARRNLVTRTQSERDRRLMHLDLTEQGRNLLRALASADRDRSSKAATETLR